jgi:TolB-like protein/Flp pilus assembly protein TadD/tRNA A-37 threonylcarbamoyl transferase component Bud32
MTGQILGHYRILEKIGAGGMGEVYRAHDDILQREVAIKTLHFGLLGDPRAKEKLLREARSSSALHDPHICTIYEVGESDGKAFIAMELVEGRPLNSLIPSQGLPIKLVVRYGTQIAAALAHAHDHGIVHRDVKTSNVVIAPSGLLKVLDFGLALHPHRNDLEDVTRTQDSAVPLDSLTGTLPYMAPEVLRGCEASERTDIWALGVVLYEMVTGKRPFQAHTANELVSEILREAPPPLSGNVPEVLSRIIERCLEKEAGHRYQRASEVRAALESVQAEDALVPLATAKPGASSRTRIAWLAGSVTFLCLGGLLALNVGGLRWRIFGPKSSVPIQSLAVLPLENLSHDPAQEYFADGMTDALITELAKAGNFRVVSRTSVMPYKDAKKTLPNIAQELGVDAIVEGSVLQSGNRVRITAQLIEARTDRHLWAENYERDVRDILSLQDEVANAIALAVHRRIAPPRSSQDSRPPVNPEAYRFYLQGMYSYDRHTDEGFQKAISFFQQAIDKDPSFASSYSALADCYMALGGFSLASTSAVLPKARAAANQALQLDDSLSNAHETLANIHMTEWNFTEAEKEFRRALELNPNYAGAHQGYGGLLSYLGRFDEALPEARKAVELDPLYITHGIVLGNVFYYRGDYDAALKEYNKVLDMDPNYWLAHGSLALTYGQKKMYPEALAELEKVMAAFPHSNVSAVLGQIKALSGAKSEARRIARELQQRSKKEYVSDYWVATIYAALGDNDQAFQLLEDAYTERSQWLIQLKVDPRFANLRSDPRFQDLLRRIGLPT